MYANTDYQVEFQYYLLSIIVSSVLFWNKCIPGRERYSDTLPQTIPNTFQQGHTFQPSQTIHPLETTHKYEPLEAILNQTRTSPTMENSNCNKGRPAQQTTI